MTLPPDIPPMDPGREETIDAYLAGRMSAEERAAFDAKMSADPDLRAEIDLRRALDASVARLYPYSGPGTPAEVTPARVSARRVFRVVGIAAAIVILAAAGYMAYLFLQPSGPRIRPPEALYTQMEQSGWKPAWVCQTDQEFVDAVARFLGAPGTSVLISLQTPGVEVLGWSFAHQGPEGTPLSERTLALLTRVEGRPVLVLMDLLERDRSIRVRAPNLHLHRREVDGFVLYEVSPFAEPRVIPTAMPATPTRQKTRGAPGPAHDTCGGR